MQIADLGQQYFTFDQARNELIEGELKDRNPFKEQILAALAALQYHRVELPNSWVCTVPAGQSRQTTRLKW